MIPHQHGRIGGIDDKRHLNGGLAIDDDGIGIHKSTIGIGHLHRHGVFAGGKRDHLVFTAIKGDLVIITVALCRQGNRFGACGSGIAIGTVSKLLVKADAVDGQRLQRGGTHHVDGIGVLTVADRQCYGVDGGTLFDAVDQRGAARGGHGGSSFLFFREISPFCCDSFFTVIGGGGYVQRITVLIRHGEGVFLGVGGKIRGHGIGHGGGAGAFVECQ